MPWDYKPTRASGLSAALQTQKLTRNGGEATTVTSNGPLGHPNLDRLIGVISDTAITKISDHAATIDPINRTPSSHKQARSYPENRSISALPNSDEICSVCRNVYSWEDEKIFTKCCDMAIGSQCKDRHIATFRKCCICGEGEGQSKIASEAETWVSFDPGEFDKETPDVPLYAASLSGTDPGRRQAQASLPPTGPTPSQNDINSSMVNTTPSSQPLFVGRTREEYDRQAIHYTWNRNSQSTSSNEVINECSAETSTTPPAKYVPTYDRCVSDRSKSSHCQHDPEGSISESRTSQEAKEYLLGAAEHFMKVFDLYGDQLIGEDKGQTVDGILKLFESKSLVRKEVSNVSDRFLGCKPFQALVNKRLLESPSEPQPAPAPAYKSFDASDPRSSSSGASCKKCEALEARFVQAMNVLRGP